MDIYMWTKIMLNFLYVLNCLCNIKTHSYNENSWPRWFQQYILPAIKEEIISILHKLFQRVEK